MSSTDVGSAAATETFEPGTIDMGLEVVTVPVSDIDRAKRFYQSLGWRLDIDFVRPDGIRSVQITPTHSACSIQFGSAVTVAEHGPLDRTYLVVRDIDAARTDLISRGVDVTEIAVARPSGFPDDGRSYFATATFKDPDDNGWLLQEITERLPGREWED
jgi:catechol 2,3-dioxygenase-like lactoylglutathione lyase family enzyme